MSHPHTLHILLTVTGAFCEIVGLSWLVANASRERGAKYGEYGVLRGIWNWLAFWLSPPSEPQNIEAAAALEATASLEISVLRANETQVERIEREVRELQERLERHEAQTAQRLGAAEERIIQIGDALRTQVERLAAEQRAAHRSALRSDVRAGQLFILGAILSMAASLV